jgi:hypothetical protein
MTRYSYITMSLALPCLILAPFVAIDARLTVWAIGTGATLAAVVFRLAND